VAEGTAVPVRHIQLSNDFNAWRSWSGHENRKQNLEHVTCINQGHVETWSGRVFQPPTDCTLSWRNTCFIVLYNFAESV
jgi:hypothetical protein